MKHRVDNDIRLDSGSVWVFDRERPFGFSDGLSSERYLKSVYMNAEDLGSDSYELERSIKDWASEYHISRKRAQLLRGFDFDETKKVLEVGCGCGAITRFLGETFDDVVAVEGSIHRARLARLRTKDMKNVNIICAPFHELKFKERFDFVYCIGVFEYSSMFIDAPHPYDFALRYFRDVLNPGGVLVLAIENQFGLKYFAGSREDHINVMFEGLEGYPRSGNKVSTFGYEELKTLLSQYFPNFDFYFPYPDYKVPSGVFSEMFFSKVNAGELVSKFLARDHRGRSKPLFDESLVLLQLDRNKKISFFSNSFLVFASSGDASSFIKFPGLGVIYSDSRVEKFQTKTWFFERDNGRVWVQKSLLSGHEKATKGMLTLHPCEGDWIDGLSLRALLAMRVKEWGITLAELFAPCGIWLRKMKSLASRENDAWMLDGKYIDYIWGNSYIVDGECVFIDHEFEWNERIDLKVLLIRSIYCFLDSISSLNGLAPCLKIRSKKTLIYNVAKNLGVSLCDTDFRNFFRLESEFSSVVYGHSPARSRMYLKIIFWNKGLISLWSYSKMFLKKGYQKLNIILDRFQRKRETRGSVSGG